MIEAFGEFVVGGNYAVGIVVFAILVIINFVVVTKGAGRISEVSARFTLDAMPGKQMAIDADLNAGLITQEEADRARARRSARKRTSTARWTAPASSCAATRSPAFLIVVHQHHRRPRRSARCSTACRIGDAGRVYTLLTIGDGLVAQIPALLLSVAVAMLVTRVSRSQRHEPAGRGAGARPAAALAVAGGHARRCSASCPACRISRSC